MSRAANSASPSPGRLLWLVPAALALAACLAGLLWPALLVRLGIYDYGTRFLDSYAVLAALDAVRAGADPHAANALDPLLRPHVYSDWWLGLRWLGLTRAHNAAVAGAWVVAFVTTASLTLRPRDWRETAWVTLLLVSPAVALVLTRANNDLVIFVLLAGCGLAAHRGGWRVAVALVCLVLATGLKYYPVVAAIPFLWVRPARSGPVLALGAMLVAGLALASVWSQVDRGRFLIGSGVYTLGAPLWLRDLGGQDALAAPVAVVGLTLLAALWVRLGLTRGLAREGAPRDRLLAAIGAVVLLACFVAGMNYAYRWIFLLWPAGWLARRAGDASLPRRDRAVAAVAGGLGMIALWQDGLFCAWINALPPQTPAWVNEAQGSYRLVTQPGQWLLMALFAGWLLEAALTVMREWRERRVVT